MKKLVLMLAVAFSVSLVACGNKEQAAEVTEEAPAVEAVVEEEAAAVVDTLTNDTTVVVAEEVAEAPAAE